MFRFTKENIEKTLKLNEGYTKSTYYKGKNFRETNNYRIHDGNLFVSSEGKTSWADSRFKNEYKCDQDQVRRFLRNNKDDLNLPK